MRAKENMKQAVRELIGMVAVGEKEEAEGTPQEDECAQAVIRTVEEILSGGCMPAGEEKAEDEAGEEPTPACREGKEDSQEAEEGTVIAAGITILGNVRSEGDIDFRGVLKGNLTAACDIVLSGRVLGDVSGRNITMLGGVVQGSVSAAGAIEVNEGAVILGDVSADAMTMNGRQKGDVRVEKMLRLREKAVLVGDVTALQISMEEGAKVQLGIVVSRGDEGLPEFAELEI